MTDTSCVQLTRLIAILFPRLKPNLGPKLSCPNISSINNDLYIPVSISPDGNCFFHALTVWYNLIHPLIHPNQIPITADNLRERVVRQFITVVSQPENVKIRDLLDPDTVADPESIYEVLGSPKEYNHDIMDLLINFISYPTYNLLPMVNGVIPRVCMYSNSAQGLVFYCSDEREEGERQDERPKEVTINLYRSGDHFSLLLTKDQARILLSLYDAEIDIQQQQSYGGKRHHTRKRRNYRLYGKTARKGKGNKQTSSIRKLALKTLKKESIQNIKKTVCWIFNSKQQKKCKASFDKSYIKSFMQAKKKVSV